MGFEVFEKGSAPVGTVPSITIQKRGLISMNRTAHAMINDATMVELLWDKDRRVIGLRPATAENGNAYPVRAQGTDPKKGPLLVAASLFTRYIGLDTSDAYRWIPTVEEGILCIDLSQPGNRVISKSSHSRGSAEKENGAAADTAAAPTQSSTP